MESCGRFITFEGGEGAGKTTQIRLLAEFLRSRAIAVELTREPGGSPGAEQIRRLLVEGEIGRWLPLTEALLHCAARHDHLQKQILPALAQRNWVLCDRFTDSTLAYQGYGHGLDISVIDRLTELTVGGFAPDLTIIFDIEVAEGLKRAGRRGGAEDRYERMDPEFHQRLRQGFLEIAQRAPRRCVVINAAAAIEEVHAKVLSLVDERFGLGKSQ